tara:strand:- start:1886 stop:2320 length:435 start_codon:yes stop_codon:yes gene_type:complete
MANFKSHNYRNADGDVAEAGFGKVEQDVEALSIRLEEAVQMLTEQLAALTLIQTGGDDPADLTQVPITVLAGHNMIGYTGTTGIDAGVALKNAIAGGDVSQIMVFKNQQGQFYAGSADFSNLTMQFGVGYYLFNQGAAFTLTWS